MLAQSVAHQKAGWPDNNSAALRAFHARFQGELIYPGDATYDSARRVWNGMIDRRPGLIARCRDVNDIIISVDFARAHKLTVAVRGGGHNVAGNAVCDDGLVIDLSLMRAVQVDPIAQTVRVEAGATIGEIDRATQPYGLAAPTGNVSETGVAGLTLGGGLGWLRRKVGMNVDSLLSAEVVTAAGELLRVAPDENSDLFWAIRGGGGNFGIVTAFTFRLYPVGPEVMFMAVMYPHSQARTVLKAWRDFTQHAPDHASTDALFWRIPPAPLFPEAIHGEPVVGLGGMYAGPIDEGMRLFQPLRALATPLVDTSGPMPYVAAQSAFDLLFPPYSLRHFWKSLYLNHLNDDVVNAILHWVESRPSPMTFIPIRHLGGTIARVPDSATAVANRAAPYLLSIDMTWADPAEDAQNIAWTKAFWQAMQDITQSGVYINFGGLDNEAREGFNLLRLAHGENYARLQRIKARYDPDNFFRVNHNIQPDGRHLATVKMGE